MNYSGIFRTFIIYLFTVDKKVLHNKKFINQYQSILYINFLLKSENYHVGT